VGVQVEGLVKIKAFVVADQQPAVDDLDDHLQAWCKQRLQRYQFPQFVEFVDDLPKTTTGKIQRYKLRARG
jgi:benzoate-CoA ligase